MSIKTLYRLLLYHRAGASVLWRDDKGYKEIRQRAKQGWTLLIGSTKELGAMELKIYKSKWVG
ncbi:hypothetical protein P4475_07920 [Halalkalibacterium halodurans]|uniref:hypothetical protein n=1 Tax=Halalkalibacterium halodurans TaxID=86665 RepID=UPI0010686C9C|nr:hypothetical protein [Halalkalibacterium halodurans]MED3646743.1 hypothetical protein [Halalkalibacterium halodurans]TES56373.1 hypothetical protein E2L07_05285 [Halalkalibacterium halodurans]TPE70545.1 hypothetical protein AMD02_002965 [Halalkalibacterium halodurans]